MRIYTVHGKRPAKWYIVLWTLGFVLLAAGTAWSETGSTPSGPSLSASVDKSVAKTGDLLWLTLTYELPAGGRLPDDPVVHGIEKLNIVERAIHPGEIKIPVHRGSTRIAQDRAYQSDFYRQRWK